jgi:transposase
MKALATWHLRQSRWLVTVCSRERAWCPLCGVQSSSRHSVYPRTLGDLSAQGTPVTVRVQVGRWRCRNERCDRRIFAERLPKVAGPFARQTNRLAGIIRLFGHSAGGRPSERLMVRLGMRVSDTPRRGSLGRGAGGISRNVKGTLWDETAWGPIIDCFS